MSTKITFHGLKWIFPFTSTKCYGNLSFVTAIAPTLSFTLKLTRVLRPPVIKREKYK